MHAPRCTTQNAFTLSAFMNASHPYRCYFYTQLYVLTHYLARAPCDETNTRTYIWHDIDIELCGMCLINNHSELRSYLGSWTQCHTDMRLWLCQPQTISQTAIYIVKIWRVCRGSLWNINKFIRRIVTWEFVKLSACFVRYVPKTMLDIVWKLLWHFWNSRVLSDTILMCIDLMYHLLQ